MNPPPEVATFKDASPLLVIVNALLRSRCEGEPSGAGAEWDDANAVHAALQAHRDAVFGPGNDKVWGEGNWVRCERCPDALGWDSYHHCEFHNVVPAAPDSVSSTPE